MKKQLFKSRQKYLYLGLRNGVKIDPKNAMKYYTITALERDQYEVLWNRVQQY
jgi:hypothetical protein